MILDAGKKYHLDCASAVWYISTARFGTVLVKKKSIIPSEVTYQQASLTKGV